MKNVLILDTETSGIDPAKDCVVEVAVILYSLEYATVLSSFASLIHGDRNEAVEINRIPVEALAKAPTGEQLWPAIHTLADTADAIVAFNKDFDRSFVTGVLRDCYKWVCAMEDIRWPKQTRERPNLVGLALEHDLGIGYAHRALADCDLIARLFTRSKELGSDLNVMMEKAMRPKASVRALVSYDDRDKAKKAGFQWDADKKIWHRRVFMEDIPSLPFRCEVI